MTIYIYLFSFLIYNKRPITHGHLPWCPLYNFHNMTKLYSIHLISTNHSHPTPRATIHTPHNNSIEIIVNILLIQAKYFTWLVQWTCAPLSQCIYVYDLYPTLSARDKNQKHTAYNTYLLQMYFIRNMQNICNIVSALQNLHLPLLSLSFMYTITNPPNTISTGIRTQVQSICILL